MSAFITDMNNSRIHASALDIANPIQGNASLMDRARSLHDMLDTFSWHPHIARFAIVGWNTLTTTGITYSSSRHCGMSFALWKCVTLPTHIQNKSIMGDGTVMIESAVDASSTQASIDLQAVDGGKTSHTNILESKTTQSIVKDFIEKTTTYTPGVTIGKLDFSRERSYIAISTHSPTEPHVYDTQGNHVGHVAPPEGTEAGLYQAFENTIPGSSFDSIQNNDGTYDTYLYVPDNGEKYSVILNGTGLGGFTYDVDRFQGSTMVNHAEYAGLPVTPLTVASTTVQLAPYVAGNDVNIQNASFVGSLKPLVIDVNGDGQTDITAVHDATTTMTTESYMEMLKKTCETIHHGKKNKNNLITISSYCKDIQDIPKRIDTIKHHNFRKPTDNDGKEIGDMIKGFVAQFE